MALNPATSKRMVTWSLFATATIVVISKVSKGKFPSPRIFVAVAVLYVILGFAADFAPTVAGPMALLVFLAVLLSEGGSALEAVSKTVNKKKQRQRMSLVRGGAS